ncbi:MAG: NAD-dependent epimerase/dehydratase family protein [Nocardioides sp.]
MKVLVTGGTGFVGSCLVAGLVEDGHDVRLLVRRPEQVATSLAPYGVEPERLDGVRVGDVLDHDEVTDALDGCDATVHAAAVFSLDSRRAEEMRRTNERAAELVR